MAKKRTIDLENAEPLRDLPSSGVQVNYKNQTIIASEETCDYTLLTGDKVCEANIGVVYVKPEAPVYSISYDPISIQPTPGAPASATAGSTVYAVYNVGAIVSVNDLSIRVQRVPDNERPLPLPFFAVIFSEDGNNFLSIELVMPALNVAISVTEA